MNDLSSFDWFEHRLPVPVFKSNNLITPWDVRRAMVETGKSDTLRERQLRMLRPLNLTCQACSLCELGRRDAVKDTIHRDPHVFSNMNPSRFMVVGQGPGWNELEKREPFVGASGDNFDRELVRNGLDRNEFYISNAVRCFIAGNRKPNYRQLKKCKPFLEMEIDLLVPRFIITLGAAAFSVFCPDLVYGDALGSFSNSIMFDVKVYGVLHPSPLNLRDPRRRMEFARQIKLLSGVIRKISQQR